MDTDNRASNGLALDRGTIVASRYEIQERLGAGGMGMVYLAKDIDLEGETIALKLLLPHLALDETAFRRFRNEVLVARTLTHPNIVRTHDIGKTDAGYSYISMEYIDGISLKDKLFTNTSQPVLCFEEALKILFQIINGVSYAHGKGIIHRDLKPANVLISSQGEVKLADFGTARFLNIDTALTQTGQMMGTPDYMSPEQIKGEELTASCDIYALGIMSYELVLGRKPFTADSAVALAFKHVNDPIPKFVNKKKGIPKWFEDFVFKATSKKKEDRYSSVAEMNSVLLAHFPTLSTQGTVFGLDVSVLQSTIISSSSANKLDSVESNKYDNDNWNFGDSSRPVVFVEEQTGNFAFIKWILIFLLIIAVGHKLALSKLSAYKQFIGSSAPLLLKISGETLEVEKKENIVAKNEQVERDNYTKELDGFLEKDAPIKQEEKVAENKLESTIATIVTTTIPTEETSTTTSTIKVTTTLVTKIEPVIIPIEQLSFTGYLMFKEGEKTVLDTHVSAEQIGLLSWTAKLDTKGGDAKDILPADEVLKELFAVNVVSLRGLNIVAKLLPLSVQTVSKESRKILVSGNLQEFAQKNPPAGDYRLDLIKSGELVFSSTLSISGNADTATSETISPVVSNTLPAAKGHEEKIALPAPTPLAAVASLEPTEEPTAVAPLVTETTETFRGVFNFTDKVGSPDEKKSLTLEIVVNNEKVSGKARIEGFEEFSVEGKVLARGMEMELRNATYGIRLTSGLKSDKMRGLYSFPAFQKKGSWEVSSAK